MARLLRTTALALLAVSVYAFSLAAAETTPYADAWSKALAYLEKTQADDGSWGGSKGKAGMTATILEALGHAPDGIRATSSSLGDKAAAYLASLQGEDGSIHDEGAPKNYCTSLAVQALAAWDKEKYQPQIAKAAEWIKRIQADEARRFKPDKHVGYGGFGYGSTTRPDLSNSWIALNALTSAGVPKDDPVWKKALIFVKRCQNSTEVNDLEGDYIGNDGGGKYLPTDQKAGSPAGTETLPDGRKVHKSYGSISYGMLAAYQWIGLDKDALPVQKVAQWCEKNFDLERNVNTGKDGQEGKLYYYRAMAKALSLYGKDTFAGKQWAKVLADKIISLQKPDGSWVNPVDRWTEGNPALATGYALTALAFAQESMQE